jgi:hypothetical protein
VLVVDIIKIVNGALRQLDVNEKSMDLMKESRRGRKGGERTKKKEN